MKVGVFGGVFNPPHLGHLILAQEAYVELGLDRVLFVPLGRATHREVEHDAGGERRYEMCELAISGDARFEVSRLEIDRDGPSFTVETLRELRRRSPDDELHLLIGGDQAAALRSWHEPDEILELAQVAVAERDDWRRDEILERIAGLGGDDDPVRFFDMPRVEVSSSLVRRRVRRRLPVRYLVPEAIERFIAEHGLYATTATASAR